MVKDSSRPSYILFLTDGLPTAGEVQEQKIAENCRRTNERRARLFCFGVGYDVNARLLDRLSGGNSGTSEYVKPDEDIETHVARFYSKMTSPVLTDVRLELAGIDINRTYPRDLPDLFEGGQIVWAGRYRQPGTTTIRVSGRVGDERRQFEFPAELASAYRGSSHDFVERLWAVRRVGDLLDQIDLHGRNKELVDELVALSMKYGLLTPYTSFLADERVPLHALSANADRASLSLESLSEVSGAYGVAQRELKQAFKEAQRVPTPSASDSQFPAQMADGSVRFVPPNGDAGLSAGPPTAEVRGAIGGLGRMARSQGAAVKAPRAPGGGGIPALRRSLPESEQQPHVAKVRQIGTKTFYFKNRPVGRFVGHARRGRQGRKGCAA
jgi:Ca-activated chloride channel family protein